MLENTVAIGERPADLVIYGGGAQAARNWDCYDVIVATLRDLADDETLLMQSGKPVARFRTTPDGPRVLTSSSQLVPRWATWDVFHDLQARGLMMYGQYTARRVAVHRQAGHPAEHLRDAGRVRPAELRRHPAPPHRPDRRARRHG